MSISVSTSLDDSVSVSINNSVVANFIKSSSSVSVMPPSAASTILTDKLTRSIQVVV